MLGCGETYNFQNGAATTPSQTSEPSASQGIVDLNSVTGLVSGSLGTGTEADAQRVLNGQLLQAAFDKASTEHKMVVDYQGKLFEYDSRTTDGAVATGLQLKSGAAGLKGLHGAGYVGTAFLQFAPNFPAITLGGSTQMMSAVFDGFRVGFGVDQTGNTNAIGILNGNNWACVYGQVAYDRWLSKVIRHPYIGWAHFPGAFFFSNEIGTLIGITGQTAAFATPQGTGDSWHNVYIGGGGIGDRNTLTNGFAFKLENTGNGHFNQLNIEWFNMAGNYSLMGFNNIQTVTFGAVHLEGNKFNGYAPAIINNSYSWVTMEGLQIYDPVFDSATVTGRPAIFSSYGIGALEVQSLDFRSDTWGDGRTGVVNMRFNLFTPTTMVGAEPTLIVNNAVFYGYSPVSGGVGMDLDPSLPAATYGEVQAFKRYEYKGGFSRTNGARINLYSGNGTFTSYGAHRDAIIVLNTPITANRNIVLSDKLRASGMGSTVQRERGDTVTVYRTAAATGSFNLDVKQADGTTTAFAMPVGEAVKRFIWDGSTWSAY